MSKSQQQSSSHPGTPDLPAETTPSENDEERRIQVNYGQRDSRAYGDEGSPFTWKRFVALAVFQITFPLLALLIACVFGGLMAWVENEKFLTGFLYVASNLLSMSNPLTEFNPANAPGVVIDIYVSVLALLLFGVVLNVVNLFQVPLAINRMIEVFVTGAFIVPFVAIFILIPLSVGVTAGVFGSILAKFEGWSVKDGVFYVIGNLLGLGTPLTDVLPLTLAGDVFDIIISSFALGTLAVFVDYVTILNPARYARKRMRDFLRRIGIFKQDDDNDRSYPADDARATEETHDEKLSRESQKSPDTLEEETKM